MLLRDKEEEGRVPEKEKLERRTTGLDKQKAARGGLKPRPRAEGAESSF